MGGGGRFTPSRGKFPGGRPPMGSSGGARDLLPPPVYALGNWLKEEFRFKLWGPGPKQMNLRIGPWGYVLVPSIAIVPSNSGITMQCTWWHLRALNFKESMLFVGVIPFEDVYIEGGPHSNQNWEVLRSWRAGVFKPCPFTWIQAWVSLYWRKRV